MLLLLSPGSLLLKSDCIKDALLFYALEFQLLLKLLTSDFLKKSRGVWFFLNYAIEVYCHYSCSGGKMERIALCKLRMQCFCKESIAPKDWQNRVMGFVIGLCDDWR